MKLYPITLLCALALALVAPTATAEFGKLDAVPAATLLLPYFEVDLDNLDGSTTLFSVNNAGSVETIAHIVLWTNVGVATLSFDISLTAFDVQTFNLRDVFQQGLLPAASPPRTLSAEERATLVAAHTGQADPDSGMCSGFDMGDNVARGYITVDAMNVLSTGFPFDADYFAIGGTGLASNENVLWGDFVYVDLENNFAQSEKLIHIEALNNLPKGTVTVRTFYRQFVNDDGRDNREFLPQTWSAGYDLRTDITAGTGLVYWRETGGAIQPFNCALGLPDGFPLKTVDLVAFDEEENAFGITDDTLFPLASSVFDVQQASLPFEKGWLFLNLNLSLLKGFQNLAERQSYVFVRTDSEGRFSSGFSATPFIAAK